MQRGGVADLFTRARPVKVHLKGLAKSLLKYSMKSTSALLSASTETKEPRRKTRLARMLNQHSI